MDFPPGLYPPNQVGSDIAYRPTAPARLRTHSKAPSIVRKQRWQEPMTKHRDSTTQVCGKPTHMCVSPGDVWRYLKGRHPQHTEKNTAQELSRKSGMNISYRTVERWRTKLPSGRHIILLFVTFPEMIRHLREPASARQAKYDAAEARHNALQAQGNEDYGKRDEEWDEEPYGS